MMYDELVRQLRYCADATTCRHCPWRSECCLHDAQRKAADAIEELSRDLDSMNDANIALYGALPQWIPVTVRLPEARTRCVTISRDGDYGLGVYTTDYGWMFPYYMGKTTHWMPLPEPPKEETC